MLEEHVARNVGESQHSLQNASDLVQEAYGLAEEQVVEGVLSQYAQAERNFSQIPDEVSLRLFWRFQVCPKFASITNSISEGDRDRVGRQYEELQSLQRLCSDLSEPIAAGTLEMGECADTPATEYAKSLMVQQALEKVDIAICYSFP